MVGIVVAGACSGWSVVQRNYEQQQVKTPTASSLVLLVAGFRVGHTVGS